MVAIVEPEACLDQVETAVEAASVDIHRRPIPKGGSRFDERSDAGVQMGGGRAMVRLQKPVEDAAVPAFVVRVVGVDAQL